MSNIPDHDDPDDGMFVEVEPLQLSGDSLVGNFTLTAGYIAAASKFTFHSNNKPILTLNFSSDPPKIWIDPDLSWDDAAKHFWNHVYRMVGKMAPWPEID
jgi:hypothetical protein